MNELSCILRTVASTASTVKTIDLFKKAIVALSAIVCGFYVIRLWRK